jgi:hypothetical protein
MKLTAQQDEWVEWRYDDIMCNDYGSFVWERLCAQVRLMPPEELEERLADKWAEEGEAS